LGKLKISTFKICYPFCNDIKFEEAALIFPKAAENEDFHSSVTVVKEFQEIS
jgi:hypothetical protein